MVEVRETYLIFHQPWAEKNKNFDSRTQSSFEFKHSTEVLREDSMFSSFRIPCLAFRRHFSSQLEWMRAYQTPFKVSRGQF